VDQSLDREHPLSEARILIVDDSPANVLLLERILRRVGYRCLRTTCDSRETADLFREFQPDLVLLDLQMPHLDGFQILEQLAPLRHDEAFVPILVLTADTARESKKRALKLGARDFLTKPFDTAEIILRIHNLLEMRLLQRQLGRQNALLEDRVQERTRNLERAQQQLLDAEQEKKQFYRDVIRAVTNGKFQLVDEEEIPVTGELCGEIQLEGPEGYATLRAEVRRAGQELGLDTEAVEDLVLAVGEAATNAIKHGSLGRCRLYRSGDRVLARVCDQGLGIRSEDLPNSILLPGFSTKVSLGMGYTLMLQLADCVWLATGPHGTVVQIEKCLQTPSGAPEIPLLATIADDDW
jgi:DNA-binding response OmpR family regulator/anti-sigma regulatory factor (Ser/Thr protein kinase)